MMWGGQSWLQPHFRRLLVLAAFCAIPACAQSIFSIGVIGGAPFTDAVAATNQNNLAFVSNSTNFTIGLSFRVNLPLNLRIEMDALYRPYDFNATSTVTAPFLPIRPSHVTGAEWTFPVLAQYRFKTPLVKPFLEAGVSIDHLGSLSADAGNFTAGPATLLRQTTAGVVLGGGVDVKIPFVRLSGELRYTRQGSSYFQAISNLNQAEILVGVHF
jgi:hypothetical protein